MKIFTTVLFFYLLFLYFAVPAINTPLTYDELNWPVRAQSLVRTGEAKAFFEGGKTLYEPPLYVVLQASLYRLFGVSNFSSRLMGVFCVILQLIIFAFFGKSVFSDPKDQWKFLLLASLLFITNPAVIQGALIPFHDTTLLPVLLTLFGLIFFRSESSRDLRSCAVLGIVFSIALWTALTAPVVVPLSMFVYYLLNRDWKGIVRALAVSIIGMGIFAVSWSAYSNAKTLDFWSPVNYVICAFFSKQTHRTAESALAGYSTTIVRFILWTGLYSFLLGLLALVKRISAFMKNKALEPVDFFMIYIVLIGIGYTFTGGAAFGFVRYYYPIFPALAIVCAFTLKDMCADISGRDLVLFFGIGILTALYLYHVVGDPIYAFNFSLREAAADNPYMVKRTMFALVQKYGLYLLPLGIVFPVIRLYKRGQKLIVQAMLSLLVMICAANISLDIAQAKADYLTRYCYGESGTEKLIASLSGSLKSGEAVLATNDIIYYLQDKKIPYLPIDFWYDCSNVIRAMKNPAVKFVVYSIGHNDIRQFREVFHDKNFIEKLKKDFLPEKIGTYTVWKRKAQDAQKDLLLVPQEDLQAR